MSKKMTIVLVIMTSLNLIVTVVMMINMIPQTVKVNELIEKVSKVIQLEIESANVDISKIPLDKITIYNVNDGGKMIINLADGKHYASISASLTIYKDSERYKDNNLEILQEHEPIIKDVINKVIRTYTKDELLKNADKAQLDIKNKLQELYGKEYIIGINFSALTIQ